MKKVLYFEGAGMNFYSNEQTNISDVGNFRIRTAFKNLEGIEYYIELGNASRLDKKYKVIPGEMGIRIDHLFKIEDCHKEEYSLGGYEIKSNHLQLRELDYTKENITNWINENLNCDFDTIEVLNDFYGYRVHGDNGGFNLMDNINVDHKRAAAREEAYNKVDMEYRQYLNSKHSKISLLNMDDESITVRCYASKEALGDRERIKQIQINY